MKQDDYTVGDVVTIFPGSEPESRGVVTRVLLDQQRVYYEVVCPRWLRTFRIYDYQIEHYYDPLTRAAHAHKQRKEKG